MDKVFDIFAYLMGKAAGGGGGGGDVTVESKSISSNGTFTAPPGKAYSPVTVDVPNSYAAGDEGKVVSNGELVAQSSDSVTQNGTVDTTLINSLLVNVPSGGVKIADGTFTGNGSNAYEGLNVGSKMPLCDFVLNVWAPDGTEFAYNDTYKVAVFSGLMSKHFVKYVPVIDSYVAPTFQIQHDINNDGTITSIALSSKGSGLESDVRNGSTGGIFAWVADAVKLKQTASAFYLRFQGFNNQHKFVSGMTYNWEIIYYGADPTHDIVEVA